MERPFSYMSEEITTAGGSTSRIIRFDEPMDQKSNRRDANSGECHTVPVRKKPGRALKPLPIPETVVTEAKLPKNPLIAPELRFKDKELDFSRDDRDRELLCYSAAVAKENESLRRYNEWLTNRVQVLERKIYELTHGVEHGDIC